MSNAESVKGWRRNTKKRIVESMGGKCCVCGYNKTNNCLALHHINPELKEMNFGKIRANPASWDKIVKELRKCILVCHNCHGEIHEGLIEIPTNPPIFNEDFLIYKNITVNFDICPICGKDKYVYNRTCSYTCASKLTGKIKWDEIDLKELLKTKSYVKISKELGCSDSSVHKRAKKLGIK